METDSEENRGRDRGGYLVQLFRQEVSRLAQAVQTGKENEINEGCCSGM